jgi:hypothetical protein
MSNRRTTIVLSCICLRFVFRVSRRMQQPENACSTALSGCLWIIYLKTEVYQ